MNLIAAADVDWGVGKDEKLLFNLPPDMEKFKQMTLGKIVVMGRKTLQSLPNGLPLKDRTNIVLSRDVNYSVDGAVVVNSIDELMKVTQNYESNSIYIIGGADIYSQLLYMCDKAFITKIKAKACADCYINNFDKDTSWQLEESSQAMLYGTIEYAYMVYKRIKHEL